MVVQTNIHKNYRDGWIYLPPTLYYNQPTGRMIYMIVDLNAKSQNKTIEVGDILVFSNGKEYDYYLIVYNNINENFYQIVSLDDSTVLGQYDSITEMRDDLEDEDNNGFKLAEILKSDEVVIRRVANGQ